MVFSSEHGACVQRLDRTVAAVIGLAQHSQSSSWWFLFCCTRLFLHREAGQSSVVSTLGKFLGAMPGSPCRAGQRVKYLERGSVHT